MRLLSGILILLACSTALLFTGCITPEPAAPAPATPTPTAAAPVTTATTPVVHATPSPSPVTPADTLPAEVSYPPPANSVDIGIQKDRVYSTITVTFLGGPGQVLVKKVIVRVTRPDGSVLQKEIAFSGQIRSGDSVDLAGTKGSDRVEVFALINGVMYKLKDENAVYAQY